jgi:hypothetical protein
VKAEEEEELRLEKPVGLGENAEGVPPDEGKPVKPAGKKRRAAR